jgi:ArsR family transcriptional regulator
VTQAAECCSVDLSVVSRHLAILRDAGVLSVRKQGRQIFYDVRYAELARTLRGLAEAIEACCPQ